MTKLQDQREHPGTGGNKQKGAIRLALTRPVPLAIILICSLVGIAGALFVLFSRGHSYSYESRARIPVRYVVEVTDGSSGSSQADTILGREIELLQSDELVRRAAEVVGPQSLLPDAPAGEATIDAAAERIKDGLVVTPGPDSTIVQVAYRDGDPDQARAVLTALIDSYFIRQFEIHRADADASLPIAIPSISIIEQPTPAYLVHDPIPWPLVLGCAPGGPLLGLILALMLGGRRRKDPAGAPYPAVPTT